MGLQKYMRALAGVVWREQNNAYEQGLNLQEETITECMLLQMARDLSSHGFRTRLYTRAREKQTGADWVWFFKHGSCRIGFRVQAKKLYRRHDKRNNLLPGRYDGHDPSKSQAQTLISRAGPNNPIYVFYNHEFVRDRSLFLTPYPGFKAPSFWGCSVSSARFVQSKKSRYLSNLHGGMIPLHELFQIGQGCGLVSGLTMLDDTQEIRVHDRDPDWLELARNPFEMQSFLETENLNGIAYFDATDVSEDLIVSR